MTPEARILSESEAAFSDGLENLVANMGTGLDKRTYSRFGSRGRLSGQGNKEEFTNLYREDCFAGKIVDIIPDDMTREWRRFVGDIEPETVERLRDEETRLDIAGAFNTAHKWARLYGTAFVVMAVDDGLTPDKPLDPRRLRPGSLRHVKAIDGHRLITADLQGLVNPMDANFGLPEFYHVPEGNTRIHHTRVLRFDGVRIPYEQLRANAYMSDSVLSRLYDALTNFNTVADTTASMVHEANVDVVKIKGFMNSIQTDESTARVRKRFSLYSLMKSAANMVLLDADEDIQVKSNSFAGLPELLDRYGLFLSAASDIPATRLLGSSARGLNATGEGDLKNYYDTVRSIQKREYRPLLDTFDQVMGASLGLGSDVDLAYEFNTLFQITDQEVGALQLVNAQRDVLYLDRGVVSELTIAQELKQSGTYTNISDDDIADLEDLDNGPSPDTKNTIPEITATTEKTGSAPGPVGGGSQDRGDQV